MPNTIALAQRYLPLLDEVYKVASRTSALDKPSEFIGANTVKYFKIEMDGLGDYDRSTGFVTGDVKGTWETMQLTQDRGRAFVVDRMDNEETLGQAFGNLAGEFIRTQVAPEIDAYTFAKIAETEGISGTNADITIGTTDVADLIEAGIQQMNEDEVPTEGRLLYISETAYRGLKKGIDRSLGNQLTVNRNVEMYNEMRVIRVPQTRFNTAIELYDGVSDNGTDETGGGYVVPTGSYKINFMIIHPSAVMKTVKHVLPRIFSPEVYQQADAWKFDYRLYYDVFVYDNKVDGIYMHRKNTAS